MKIYLKILHTIYLHNYYTDNMILVVMACVTYSSTILSHDFQFPFSFKDVTTVC